MVKKFENMFTHF